MKHAPVELSRETRVAASAAIAAAASKRGWRLHAHSVLADHVHVVITAAAETTAVLHDLKALTTGALRRAKHFGKDEPVWSDGGSVEMLLTIESARRAVHYVLYGQGDEVGVEGESV